MSGTLYRIVKTYHQDMDQDEHAIFQMFSLSFYEHNKEHSMFVDNKNGIYHLKQFPFLSFTLREKNELFYKLKNKYFGEKCTCEFEPASARNELNKTYSGGSKGRLSILIHIFTITILCLLFKTDYIIDNRFIKSKNPNRVTGKDIKELTIKNIDTALNNPAQFIAPVNQNQKTFNEFLEIQLCSNSHMKLTKDKMKEEQERCYVHLFNILKKKKMEPAEKKVLIEFENYLYNSGENDFDSFMKKRLNDNKREQVSEGNALTKYEPRPGYIKSFYKYLADLTTEVAQQSNMVDGDMWKTHLTNLKDKIVKGDIVFTDKDISDVDVGSTVTHLEWIKKFLFPKQSRINHDMVMNRLVFALAAVAPILCNLISLITFKNKVSKNSFWMDLRTYMPMLPVLLSTITSFSTNIVISDQYYLKTWVLYYISNCAVNYLISSCMIRGFPAYRYYKGSYKIKVTTDNREILELINDEFDVDNLISDKKQTICTRFLPGDIVSITSYEPMNKNQWIVLALAGDNKEKRILINKSDFYPKNDSQDGLEHPNLLDIIYVSIDECYSMFPSDFPINSERNLSYKTDVLYGLTDNPTQSTIEKLDGGLSIIFFFCNEYYYIERNNKEDNLIKLKQSQINEIVRVYGVEYIDFSWDIHDNRYKVFISKGNNEYEIKEITPTANYSFPEYKWETETERFVTDYGY